MHLDSLKYFMDIVEEKSISKAAKKAHISQSALSQMINKLEEDFGHELLKRSNRGVSMTPVGEIVFRYAGHIHRNAEKMISEISAYADNQNRITIAGITSLSAYSLPCVLYRLKKHFPNYVFDLEDRSSEEIILDIKNDSVDIGFVDEAHDESTDLVYTKLGKEKVVLIAAANYRVDPVIDLNKLMKVELIMCTMNHKTCEHIDAALHVTGKDIRQLNVIFHADALASVKSSVLNGYGMAFVPYEAIKHELYEKSVKIVEVTDLDLDYDIYMVTRKPKEINSNVKDIRQYLMESGTKIFC